MLRTKLQSKKNLSYTQLYNVVENALKQDGVLSMWRGIVPTLLRDVPFSGNFKLVWHIEFYEKVIEFFCSSILQFSYFNQFKFNLKLKLTKESEDSGCSTSLCYLERFWKDLNRIHCACLGSTGKCKELFLRFLQRSQFL